jgi:Mg2+ and Co2+ transporter CorA
VATVFGTLTVLTGLYGMNVRLPFVSDDSVWPFWGIVLVGATITAVLYLIFRRNEWL